MTKLDRTRLEGLAAELMEKQFRRVPKMRELHAGEWIDRGYFVRHLVETVLRIRLNIEVDTYAFFKVGAKDDSLAAKLAKYIAEEFGPEGMFTRDLAKFGMSIEEMNASIFWNSTIPFPRTRS